MKMTKYSGTFSEYGNTRDVDTNARAYDYLIVGGQIIKDVVVVSKLETKLRSSLGDKIDLHIVGHRLVAITEPSGQMFAFHYPGAPTAAFAMKIMTAILFGAGWWLFKFGRSDNQAFLAVICIVISIFTFLGWLIFRPNGKIQKVIAKELPKDAIMMN